MFKRINQEIFQSYLVNFRTVPLFDKQFKKLSKKYTLIKDDMQELIINFEDLHLQSTSIKTNLYKIRLANSNKNKGKRAGYRIYYYIRIEETVHFLTIYDKSEIEKIDETVLINLIKNI